MVSDLPEPVVPAIKPVVHGLFMEIEVDQIVLPAQTDRNSQTLVGAWLSQRLKTLRSLKVSAWYISRKVTESGIELLSCWICLSGQDHARWLPYHSLQESDPIGSQAHEEPLLARAIALGYGP